MLRVLGRTSSINVRKVLWTCAEIGIPFQQEDWGAGFKSAQSLEFLAFNPVGLIPVIIDDGFVMRESNAIVRYLAAKHRRTDLWPDNVQHRAIVDMWMDWQNTELNAAWRYAFMGLVRKNPACQDPKAIADSLTGWGVQMRILEQHLAAGGTYITGTFTAADIVIGLAVHRWFATPFARPALPHVAAYYDLLTEREGFRAHGRNGVP